MNFPMKPFDVCQTNPAVSGIVRFAGRTAAFFFLSTALWALCVSVRPARADETCMSPYMPKITGQEEFVYVWTLGVEGWGDGSDKLVTVDARPGSPTYGQVMHITSVGGRHEAPTQPRR